VEKRRLEKIVKIFKKTRESRKNANNTVSDHFVDANEMVLRSIHLVRVNKKDL